MSPTETQDAAESRDVSSIGARFGLDAEDAELMAGLCSGLLQEAGIGGDQFLARLGQGDDLGAALGLPADLTEFLYARAHRWFTVDRADRAEPLFRALCVLDGQIADYWIGLGICLRLRDSLDAAALAFGTAARLRPQWAVPAFHAAELAIRNGDYGGAAGHLARFRQTADHDIPERMSAEAARMAAALELHAASAANTKPGGTSR
jgi:tetratricopeptide (TPR) repeat protein